MRSLLAVLDVELDRLALRQRFFIIQDGTNCKRLQQLQLSARKFR